jgi:uncharacterized membrane protein
VHTKEEDKELQKSIIGRLVNALPFLVIILILAGWSAGFYALQASNPGEITESLRCLTFFGGLVVAILMGALIGTFLKRLVWKMILKRVRKHLN